MMNFSVKTNKHSGLQALRCFAFVLIFLSHCAKGGLAAGGPLGVCVFCILSGFCLAMKYEGSEEKNLISTQNVIRKVSSFYQLYFALLLFMVFYRIVVNGSKAISVLRYFVADLFLLQAWVPKGTYYFSLDAPCWYLSVYLFLYLVSGFIHRVINRIVVNKRIYIYIYNWRNDVAPLNY